MVVVARAPEIHDWTYRDARHRMVRVARGELPQHRAVPRLDDGGNRIVDCDCGWVGNGLGWAGHLDDVVRSALDDGRLPA